MANPKLVESWPELSFASWQDTCETLHRYMQIAGKIRLKQTFKTNQWWNVALYTSARGLTTSPIAYGNRTFDMEFDLVDHNLIVRTSDGAVRALTLGPRSVSAFYSEVMTMLKALGIDVHIYDVPSEVSDTTPFSKDSKHTSYDREAVGRFWTVLRQVDQIFKEFRSGFRGKCSPVHFFWGSFDLAVTRFSGKPLPLKQELPPLMRDSIDEEEISLGFWPGNASTGGPIFFSYTIPAPADFSKQKIHPAQAFFSEDLKEFVLKYEDVRKMKDPHQAILDFAQSTYEAGARLARWDIETLQYPRTMKKPAAA